ncbi:histone-lysine N-methyltransferase SMYD3-like [Lingula anatina]|uniref:Histone-lysine N-methyltransferase SMYD3-like n=1 Tax=Lingula anatina TaxID=7574 RepID=A0A1S3KE41_LINAN|nr:histone-lysine N-methyltransferase SMYD3-like [Lingula anatina]|eukprot:XP_013420893.1 histone-lysine N-methyltransferase SMYD3-like [Lingula anatina]
MESRSVLDVLIVSDGVQHTCLVCGKDTFSEEYLSKCSSSSADAEQILKKIAEAKKEKDFKMVLELSGHCLSEVSDHLHPMHILMIRLHDSAFDACIELQKWDLALVYASKTTEAYREFYAAYHPNLGIHLMKIGKIQQYLKQLEPALKNLQQAEDILHVSHGKGHSLCQDLKILLKQCEEELRIQQGRT